LACSLRKFHFLGKLLFPFSLSALYPYPIASGTESLPTLYLLAPIAVLALVVGLIARFRNHRKVIFGFLFFAVNLVLILQIISVGNAIIADRYTYIASIGFFIFLTYLLHWIFDRLPYGSKQKAGILPALAVMATVVWGAAGFQQCGVWENSDTLWSQAIENTSPNPVARIQRGSHFRNSGKANKAMRDFNALIKEDPQYHKGWYHRGQLYEAQNELEKAEKDLNKAISIYENDFEVWNSRGAIYYKQKDFEKAIADYNRSIDLNPNFHKSHYNRAIAYHQLGDKEQALRDYDRAIELFPTYQLAIQNRNFLLNPEGH